MNGTYLDNNATSCVHPDVFEEMVPYFSEEYGNAASVHGFGRQARKAVEKARFLVAEAINAASPEEIIFTSGGTESDNYALMGIVGRTGTGAHIITSVVEHPAVLNTAKYLEKTGVEVTWLEVDSYGRVSPEQVEAAIKENTALVSVMTANNETGTIMPVREIGDICRQKGVVFHSDAVQALGKIPLDVQEKGIDMASFSGHKIYGPKGVGVLYVKKGIKPEMLNYGGHQEQGRRPGTQNVPGIVGMGKACELFLRAGHGQEIERQRKLRDGLHERIASKIKDIKLNGHPEKRLPNTLNVSFKGLEGESIILSLDLEGIAVSTGSACTSGNLEPSHVLKSMGLDPLFLQGSVRFSLGRFTSEPDVDRVMAVLPGIIKRLRALSPVYGDIS